MKFYALIFASVLGFLSTANAQRYEVGVSMGASLYIGDLFPGSYIESLKNLEPDLGVLGRLNVTELLTFRLSYNYLVLSGDDKLKSGGNFQGLMFRSRVHELNIAAEINLFRLYLNNGNYFSPYFLAGGGLYNFKPIAKYDPVYARNGGTPLYPELVGEWIQLQPLGTSGQGLNGYDEPYQLTRGNVLLGGGLKYRVGPKWMIGVEAIGRLTFFDYLDDISNVTMTYGDILNGNGGLAAEMSKPQLDPRNDANLGRTYFRGGDADDYYISMTATVTYLFGGEVSRMFGGGVKCPRF